MANSGGLPGLGIKIVPAAAAGVSRGFILAAVARLHCESADRAHPAAPLARCLLSPTMNSPN